MDPGAVHRLVVIPRKEWIAVFVVLGHPLCLGDLNLLARLHTRSQDIELVRAVAQ